MKNIQQKDRFLGLLEQNKKIIYKISNAYCRDAETRRDLEQEILVQLWRAFPRYDERFKFSTWLYRIALNVSISFYRSESRRKRVSATMEESVLGIVDDASGAEEQNPDIQLLHRFINRLGTLNKALMLLYLDDHSHKEMSEILGISQTNVATKISRIKLKLKNEFRAYQNA